MNDSTRFEGVLNLIDLNLDLHACENQKYPTLVRDGHPSFIGYMYYTVDTDMVSTYHGKSLEYFVQKTT